MDAVPLSTAPTDNDQRLQQDLQQLRLQQAQIYSQMQAQMLKQNKGPSKFRTILGVVAGAAAGVFAPGLGGAIGTMVTGNGQSNSVNNLAALNAMNTFAANSGLAGNLAGSTTSSDSDLSSITNKIKDDFQQSNVERTNKLQQELSELRELEAQPNGLDPIKYLAFAEKTNAESEVLQATTAVAKSKHQAAMAAIQNIKD